MEKLDIERVLNFLLLKQYESEFIIEEGLNQHKDGLSYQGWLRVKSLIEL